MYFRGQNKQNPAQTKNVRRFRFEKDFFENKINELYNLIFGLKS